MKKIAHIAILSFLCFGLVAATIIGIHEYKQPATQHGGFDQPDVVTTSLDTPTNTGLTKTVTQESFGDVPLNFETNRGQTDGQVKFISRSNGCLLFFTSSEAVLSMQKRLYRNGTNNIEGSNEAITVLRMQLSGSNRNPRVRGLEKLKGAVHYFFGDNPQKWFTNIPVFAKIHYENVYPGIDIAYYGNHRQLEYDIIVSPHVSPEAITLRYVGADTIEIDPNGDLILRTKSGDVIQRAPVIYQETDTGPQYVSGGYEKRGDDEIGFLVAAYDVNMPLVIDPVLSYSIYFGGSDWGDSGSDIAVDAAGHAYVTGTAQSTDFPVANPIQPLHGGGGADAFITKINTNGSAFVYSTFLGGSGNDQGNSIAVDDTGNVYVTGSTGSGNFPVVNPLQDSSNGGRDVFVTKLNSTGSALMYSTYLGGDQSDEGEAIAVDHSGNVYLTGVTHSDNFPTSNAIQDTLRGSLDAFVSKLDPSGTGLVYSTYLGGSDSGASTEWGIGIAVDGSGNTYVRGVTASDDFPTMNPIQPSIGGRCDAFVVKITPDGSSLFYSTYLGGNGYDGSNNSSTSIAVDSLENAYVTGTTTSDNFPTENPLQPTLKGSEDGFITKLNADGSAFIYSTYFGGSNADRCHDVAVDASGNVYITGETWSFDFPLVNPIQPFLTGFFYYVDGFITKLNAEGSGLEFSTYYSRGDDFFSGIALDDSGDVYVTGTRTIEIIYPKMNSTQQAPIDDLQYRNEVFVVKVSIRTEAPPMTQCPQDSTIDAYSTIPFYELDGFEITNPYGVTFAFIYELTSSGPAVLIDNGNPNSLHGITPYLSPYESFTPANAALEIPAIRTPSQQIVMYHVYVHGHPELSETCSTIITFEPPVSILIKDFHARASETSVVLTWDVASDEVIKGYKIYRGQGKQPTEVINPDRLIASDIKKYTDKRVRSGQTYQYTLAVVREDDTEIISETVFVRTNTFSPVLHQNFPNPFNPITTISFVLPDKAYVNLSVFDTRGNLVRILLNKNLLAGFKELTWDGKDTMGNAVSSGVYFYRLKSGNLILSKKMVLIR